MSWRLAKSLVTLRNEVNAAFPNRSKVSDGTIGDAAHRSRPSDHNPNSRGVVTAIDITEDAENGIAEINDHILDIIIARRDPRVKYLIHEGRILRSYPKPGIPAWTWAPYTGSNKHFQHVHISVQGADYQYDNPAGWGITGVPAKPAPVQASAPAQAGPALLRRGSKGPAVRHAQGRLLAHRHRITVDGDYGPATEREVKAFQKARGLAADGIVGPATLAKLNAAVAPLPAPAKAGSKRPAGKPPLLKQGSKGEWVKYLQGTELASYYKGKVDGDFGPATKAAVVAFQKRYWPHHKGEHDGIVGSATWTALGVK